MMNRPDNLKEYDVLDLKLGIKSSLPKVKSTLALLILLWECADRPAELIYSKQDGETITLIDELKESIQTYLSSKLKTTDIDFSKLWEKINENQLFKSQIESLIVAFELVWKLGRISFVKSTQNYTIERTGRVRYPKKILFSVNADLIHGVLVSDQEAYTKIILSWIGYDIDITSLQKQEVELKLILTALSEGAIFKLADRDKEILFNQYCIYDKALDTKGLVDINGDKEAKGSLRILKSLLSDNLNPYLNYKNGSVSINEEYINRLECYKERVNTYLRLSATRVIKSATAVNERNNQIVFLTNYHSPFPHNRILFGAPGTGKSYTLNKDRIDLLGADNEEDYERVTFHPDYSYSHFVGTYKPVSIIDNEGHDAIVYKYVPGPFMRMYVKALKNIRTGNPKPFLLIIEEINRANVAAVFGDVFQLLDRKDDGVSQYPIEASEDIKKYLASELGGEPENYNKIRIPSNLFIWATMNSADQGVFPMDTAFKRRWDFTYLGVDDNDEDLRGKYVFLADDKSQKVEWNQLRKEINGFLAREKINEDKQLGPYFISRNIVVPDGDIIDRDKFIEVFKNKVIMYLFEDAAKQKREKLFQGCFDNSNRYSKICEEFDAKGIGIFNPSIHNNIKVENNFVSVEISADDSENKEV